MNAVHLIGRVDSNFELRKTRELGRSVVNLVLVTHETWRDKNGKMQEADDAHHLVFWGYAAEVVAARVRKGDLIGVDGKLKTREYEKDGEMKRSVEVNVTRLHLVEELIYAEGDEPAEAQCPTT